MPRTRVKSRAGFATNPTGPGPVRITSHSPRGTPSARPRGGGAAAPAYPGWFQWDSGCACLRAGVPPSLRPWPGLASAVSTREARSRLEASLSLTSVDRVRTASAGIPCFARGCSFRKWLGASSGCGGHRARRLAWEARRGRPSQSSSQ